MIPLQADATEQRPVKCTIRIDSKTAWLLTHHLSLIINVGRLELVANAAATR
jgi:hypothetical protein